MESPRQVADVPSSPQRKLFGSPRRALSSPRKRLTQLRNSLRSALSQQQLQLDSLEEDSEHLGPPRDVNKLKVGLSFTTDSTCSDDMSQFSEREEEEEEVMNLEEEDHSEAIAEEHAESTRLAIAEHDRRGRRLSDARRREVDLGVARSTSGNVRGAALSAKKARQFTLERTQMRQAVDALQAHLQDVEEQLEEARAAAAAEGGGGSNASSSQCGATSDDNDGSCATTSAVTLNMNQINNDRYAATVMQMLANRGNNANVHDTEMKKLQQSLGGVQIE